jgi:hypothetical protein
MDWPVERAIDRSKSFHALNQFRLFEIADARGNDWPVNKPLNPEIVQLLLFQ